MLESGPLDAPDSICRGRAGGITQEGLQLHSAEDAASADEFSDLVGAQCARRATAQSLAADSTQDEEAWKRKLSVMQPPPRVWTGGDWPRARSRQRRPQTFSKTVIV